MNHGLIIPGDSVSGVRFGASYSELISHYGDHDNRLDYTAYHTFDARYTKHGISFRLKRIYVISIVIYHEGVDNFNGFQGQTSEGISVNSTRREVEAIYGRPNREDGEIGTQSWADYERIGIMFTYNTPFSKDPDAQIRYMVLRKVG